MRVKPLMRSRSEQRTYRILGSTLPSRRYRISGPVPLQEVIESAPGELDGYNEWLYYATARFDFVVSRAQDDMPLFAVEFDGPQHETNADQIRRDKLKNRFCRDAAVFGFPLLRITSEQIQEHEQVTVLAWMLERYIAWQEEAHKIWDDCRERLDALPAGDPLRGEPGKLNFLDPAFDPTVLFDLAHPYPALQTIAHRLRRKGIFATKIAGEDGTAFKQYVRQYKPRFYYRVKYPRHSFWSHNSTDSGKNEWTSAMDLTRVSLRYKPVSSGMANEIRAIASLENEEILYTSRKTVSLKWAGRTGRKLPANRFYGPRDELVFFDLPGVSIPDIAEGLSECLCLRELEQWAVKTLSRTA